MKALLLLTCMVFTGCRLFYTPGKSEDLSLAATHDAYAPADTVLLRLRNGTDERIEVSYYCPPMLQVQTPQGWNQPRQWDDDLNNDGIQEGCILMPRVVSARSTATYEVPLPVDLPAGLYRFEERVTFLDTQLDTLLLTPPFQVETE